MLISANGNPDEKCELGQAVIIRRNTPACGVAETYLYPFASWRVVVLRNFSFLILVRQLTILQFTGWNNCAICGSLFVLANYDFRCAVDVSAPVFRIFHPNYHLR